MRILLVDDDPEIQHVVAFALSHQAGYDVVCAAAAADALAEARRQRPGAILLDVQLPDLDGPAFYAQLKAEPSLASVPVVFLTGAADGAARDRLLALGARGVLAKPFDPLALAGAVVELVG
ncbi:MAG: response regulator [Gemmatimonadota bacterium]